MKNCYIHIPFCDNICSYCDFCKVFYKEEFVDKYLDALEKEIKSIYQGEVLDTIYIGGGTPSCLNIRQLEKLFKIINILKRSNNCNITIEGNFESTTEEKLLLYKKYGVKRVSFGIESINKKNLALLERDISLEKTTKLINYCKEIGLKDINVDLMYALPGEDLEILAQDLEFILKLDVPHIATYSLIIEENTKLGIKKVKNINEDLDYTMYKYICKKLKENNYIHYEISNFCKKGYESKHNMCYWENKKYYGFGLGASSYIGTSRITNTKSLTKYLKGKLDYLKEEVSVKDEMEYEVILGLRMSKGISLAKFYDKFKVKLNEVYDFKNLIENKLLIYKKGRLFIPENKWYISNEIIIRFLEGVKNG